MAGTGQTDKAAAYGLKSDESQVLSEAVTKLQREYNKAKAAFIKAEETLQKIEAAPVNTVGAEQEEYQKKRQKAFDNLEASKNNLANATSEFVAAAEKKERYITEVLKQSKSLEKKALEDLELCRQLNPQEAEKSEKLYKAANTEVSLAVAALSDITTIVKELEKNKQTNKKHNPAPSKRPEGQATINKQKLAEEIVAVLAEADKVKNTPKAENAVNTEKKQAKPVAAAKPAAAAAKPATSNVDLTNRYRLKKQYVGTVTEQLKKQFNYSNVNEVPKLVKIMLNMGLGDVKDDAKKFAGAVEELKTICGQKPIVTKAKKSIANFKLREGMNIGAKVTLRGNRMYEWLDKLITVALPRVRDFKGLNPHSFDGRGNYAMGVKEQLIFPEIKYDQIDKIRGFDICIVTTAKTDEEAKALLKALGMPFKA